jgi:hypothetical protein
LTRWLLALLAAVVVVAGCAGLGGSNGSAAPSLAEVPEITPRPTPSIPIPKSYAKLAKADWAKILGAPAKSVGKGYQVWACITAFDTTTGRDSFRAASSYRKEPSWSRVATNAHFNGTEKQLAGFVAGDVVQVNAVGLGSFPYAAQGGGTTAMPTFYVTKISRKGSCG